MRLTTAFQSFHNLSQATTKANKNPKVTSPIKTIAGIQSQRSIIHFLSPESCITQESQVLCHQRRKCHAISRVLS